MKVLGALVLMAFLLILGPSLFIWSVNTMIIQSGLGGIDKESVSAFFNPIPLNVWTWLATIMLGGVSVFGVVRK